MTDLCEFNLWWFEHTGPGSYYTVVDLNKDENHRVSVKGNVFHYYVLNFMTIICPFCENYFFFTQHN